MEKTGHKEPSVSSSSSHQPWSARVTDEETMIVTRDGLLMDPHQQVGLNPGLPSPTARGVPLPSPHHLSPLTYPLQGTVPIFLRGQNHFPSTWFESTFCGFLFLVIIPSLLQTDGNMGAQPRTSMDGDGAERQGQQEEEFTRSGASTREDGGAT